ncbi:cellulose binding domain-containing protein, partial [Umezawaea sp.]|uniref:cellulose binding domain-containing protein n=1 Tax=Umezawaea sp. TaxID=1955258 RepID=UPI002ED391E4
DESPQPDNTSRPDDPPRPDDTGPIDGVPPTGGTQTMAVPRRVPWRKVALAAGAAALVAIGVVVGVSLRSEPPAGDARSAPTGTTASAATTTTTTTAPAGCAARLRVTNSWPDGYQAEVVVRNASGRTLAGWTVTWPQPAASVIDNLWNGVLSRSADSVTVTSADYNASLPVDGTTTLGFTAVGPATEPPDVTCTSGG